MLHPSNLIGKQLDQFRLDEFIAKGAMGIVFKAFDTVLVRTVALKLISKQVVEDLTDEEATMREEARKRLIQEAKAAGRLNHPNILTIYSYGETEDFEYICMEYLRGKTLNQLLSENKVIDVELAMSILEQILRALDAANKEQIVHRDIKPSNIMITDDNRVKVMDFGIAKLPSFSMTTTGTVLGTPYYMSPEQISGQKVDIRSDIFSVGAVLYQIITGERPFEATNTATLAYKIVQVDPIPPDVLNVHVPHPLGRILKRALAKNPAERYQTPIEMMQDLNALRADKRSLGYEDVTIVRRDQESEKTAFSKAVDFDMTVRAGTGTAEESEPVTEAAESPAPKVRLVEFRRSLDSEDKREQTQRAFDARPGTSPSPEPGVGVTASDEEGDREQAFMDKPAARSGTHQSTELAHISGRRRTHEFEGGVHGKRYRIMGVLVVLLIVVGFWVVAYNAFREIREGVPPSGDSTRLAQERRSPSPSTPPAHQPETARPAALPAETAVPPVAPSGQPSAEQLIVEAKGIWSSDPEGAQKLLGKAVALYPNHFDASFQLARLLAYRMDYGAAVQQYRKALQINSQNPEAYFNLGYIYLTQGDYDAAIQNLEACLALKPPFQDEVLTNLGVSYLKKNFPDRANELFKQALDVNSANSVAKGYLATAGQVDDGRALAVADPGVSKPLEPVQPADQLVAQAKDQWEKDPALARRLLETAVAQNPLDFEAVFQLGRLLTFQKDYTAAIDHYQRALRLNEQSADAHFNLGYIFLVSKEYDKAIQHYEACLALSPPYRDEVLTNLGLSHLKKGNVASARKLFNEALDLNPTNEVARGYLRNIDKQKRSRSEATLPVGSEGAQKAGPSASDRPSVAMADGTRRFLEGDYLVEGMTPSGSTYKGKATLLRNGEGFKVTWVIANVKFSGSGKLNGDVLAVDWKSATGASGLLNYQVGSDGTLKGSWGDGAGMEILSPAPQ